jgi:hypothetical protein
VSWGTEVIVVVPVAPEEANGPTIDEISEDGMAMQARILADLRGPRRADRRPRGDRRTGLDARRVAIPPASVVSEGGESPSER